MFIDKIQKTNQELLDVAFAFQQNGQILPDSYVIDMDICSKNFERSEEKRSRTFLHAETGGEKSIYSPETDGYRI